MEPYREKSPAEVKQLATEPYEKRSAAEAGYLTRSGKKRGALPR